MWADCDELQTHPKNKHKQAEEQRFATTTTTVLLLLLLLLLLLPQLLPTKMHGHDINTSQEAQNYDTIYVETTMGNKKLMVAIVYRPAKQLRTDETALYNEIQSTIRNKNAVIVGDFNCPILTGPLCMEIKRAAD